MLSCVNLAFPKYQSVRVIFRSQNLSFVPSAKKTMEAIAIPPKDRDIKASWPPRICQGKREVWTGNTRPEKLLIRIQSDGKKFPLIPMCDHI